MAKVPDNQIVAGVILYRDPDDRYKSVREEPIYADATPEVEAQVEQIYTAFAQSLAQKLKQYMEAQSEESACK